MQFLDFIKNHRRGVIITLIVLLFVWVLFAVPFSTVKTDNTYNLYVSGTLVESKSFSTPAGFKTVAVSNSSTGYKESTIFLLPFQSYQATPSGSKQTTENILKESGYDKLNHSPVLSEKYLLNGSWLVIYDGVKEPDSARWVTILRYDELKGVWQIVIRGDTFDTAWQNGLPAEVYQYVKPGGQK